MCDDCRRAEAKDFWRACVQVRQKCEFKKTLFYLEQLVLKHGVHLSTTTIKPVPTGIDFFYAKLQDARKFVDFITSHLPCKYSYAQVRALCSFPKFFFPASVLKVLVLILLRVL